MKKKFLIAMLIVVLLVGAGIIIHVFNDDDEEEINTFLITKLVVNLSSPQEVDTKIRITVSTNGASGTQYQYHIYDGEDMVVAKPYSTSRIYDWTPTEEGNYKITVWAKVKDSVNEKDAERTIGFTIGSEAPAINETYIIELNRWGIDGDPYNNSIGINNALIWASQTGYKKIQFPTKKYVISEYVPIIMQHMRDVTIDLNGATIKIKSNALKQNQIVFMAELRNVKLINGTIMGDIGTHNYAVFPGSTEGNLGILIERGVVDCQIDNVTVKDVTGWGIVTSHGGDYNTKKHGLSMYNLENGGMDLNTGEKIPSITTIRTINPIEVSELDRYEDKFFILGYDLGYMNNIYMATRQYDAIFYDKDMNILGSASGACYKKTYFPAGMAYVDFVVYQPNVPTKGDSDFGGAIAFITHHVQPTNVSITNCVIDNCRSLGMAICGGDSLIIQNNILKNTQNLAPGFAIDAEDGWELMNNIQIIENTFENNGGDMVICAGDNFVFRGNNFSGTVSINPRATNYIFEDNNVEGVYKESGATVPVRMGFRTDTIIRNNKYVNVGHGVTRHKEGVALVWENEELINSSIMGMSLSTGLIEAGASNPDIVLRDSSITSEHPVGRRLAGTYINCYFDVRATEMIGATVKDSIIDRLNCNNQQGDYYENCVIKNSSLSSTSSTTIIALKDCTITDTSVNGNTWAGKFNIDIQNCNITMTSEMKRAFVYFAGGKLKTMTFKNNTVNNMSAYTIFNMNDVSYSSIYPDADIILEDNTFEQDSGYIFTGKKLVDGIVRVLDRNNTKNGLAEMYNPIQINDTRFIISTT